MGTPKRKRREDARRVNVKKKISLETKQRKRKLDGDLPRRGRPPAPGPGARRTNQQNCLRHRGRDQGERAPLCSVNALGRPGLVLRRRGNIGRHVRGPDVVQGARRAMEREG